MSKISDRKLEIIIKKAFNRIAESDMAKIEDISSDLEIVDYELQKRQWAEICRCYDRERQNISSFYVRVAMIVLALLSVITITVLASPPIYAAISDFILNEKGEFLSIEVPGESLYPNSIQRPVFPEYLPENTAATVRFISSFYVSYGIYLDGEQIGAIDQYISDKQLSLNVEISDSVFDTVLSSGVVAKVVEYENGSISLFWKDQYFFTLKLSGYDLETVVLIAEGLK
ncbi:MAG: hypothetical protein IJB44_05515 [Clostridia bacterium]|nr:hypothetical protein [Clostridia bacterium]